ncbi:hypothetical protein Tco_1132141 [Tanacetum coccineum]|uniref:Uncharacterized protein n=1 Tax=Tanacetum coccineum TaxID=301880 RepID=A0ABQ5JCH4_9ASTR
MMVEIYQAFKGQPSSAPSGSVTPTLTLTHIPTNIEGENATNTATNEPPSHTEGGIEKLEQWKFQDGAFCFNHHFTDPDKPVRVEFMINGKTIYLTEQEIQEYWDKEEKIKKAAEEAKLLAMSRPEVIKVVQEEAEKIGLDPRKIASAKAGEKFKKAQDAGA